jgi:hypothetical protein
VSPLSSPRHVANLCRSNDHHTRRDHRFHGQNLPYPGYATHWGFAASTALIAALSTLLYLAFKRKDWL